MAALDNSVNAGGFLPEGAPPEQTKQSGYQPNVSDLLKQRHAQTASRLAGWLLGMLGGTVVLHYICIMILIVLKRDESVKILEDFYHSWLPVLSGLAGSAATYYFTRDGK
jgi:hypothetical protein